MKICRLIICVLFTFVVNYHLNAIPQELNYHPLPSSQNPLIHQHESQFTLEPGYEIRPDHHFSFNQLTISKHDYTLEDHFDVDSNHGHIGNVVQSSFSLRKNYAYYDWHGNLESSAYVRFLSFGTLFTSATAMDIYDAKGSPIGEIEGSFFTFSPAKFYFYDGHNVLKGIAYLDNDRSSFTIYHPEHFQKIIAIYSRIFVRDVQDWWVVDIIDSEAIDYRVLISFGAFAVDTQGEYKEDI
jgi:uncharacterized protein YxjI